MVNRFRELLPYAEVPIRLMIRGREGGKPPVMSPEHMIERPAQGTQVRPQTRKKKSTKPVRPARPKRNEAKPKPKRGGTRGPARGTRPR
jgi:hypothetical protein